jgi:SAM-dependent methyltransferase
MDNVLEHILDPEKLILEVHRILKNRGRIIIGILGVKGFELDFDHKVFYDDVKLINSLNKFNFKFIKNFYTPFNSEFFNKNLKSYCLYCVFEKV